MMNPQYPPPGQNNNAPTNPMFPPTSQDFNGAQNANIYSQMPPNGPQMPPKPFDQTDMSQKMQNMNINGSQGFPSIPPTQLPPGQLPPGQFPAGNYPPTSNYAPGQLPPGQRPPGMPNRPPVSGAPVMTSMGPNTQIPPMSGSAAPPGFNPMPPQSVTPNMEQDRQFQPPTSMPPQQRPPSAQPNQVLAPGGQQPAGFQAPGQMLPTTPGQPSQQALGRPNMPPQGVHSSKPGMPPAQMGGPPLQPGPPGLPHGMPQQMSAPPQSQSSPMSQPGMPLQNKFGQPGPMPGPPGLTQPPSMMSGPPSMMSGQPSMMSGPPSMMSGPPSMMSGPPSMTSQPSQVQQSLPHSGQNPGNLHGPPQPSSPSQPRLGMPPTGQQIPGQPGIPSQSGQPGLPPQPGPPGPLPQPGQMSQSGLLPQPGQLGQPGLPPQPGQMPGPPGMAQQPGQMPGVPSQPGQMHGQTGMPPQPGHMQQGLPSQPGFPPQQFQQQQQLPGMPHMPPPLSQQKQQYPGMPPVSQPGYGAQPGSQPGGQYPGMPPIPGQLPSQPMPGQQQRGYQQPSSGYPAQYQAPYPGQQASYPGQQYQQPEQKRLDPEQMPSPIQVMAQDQQNRGGLFVTNEKGLVPPLATTDFTVDDKGNASPRYIRSSMYTVPVTADLLKQTSMPFCLVISPMAETVGSEAEPPLIDFAALTGSPTLGPVRCSRCKAYICPNMKFVDAGRHFKCAFCKATTEVAMEYTQYVNSTQQYGRVPAELALGTYEILATKEYCRNNTLPNPPAIVFVIDVSYNAIKNGLVQTVCDNIMDIIEAMPRDEQTGRSWTRVGFITYSSTVHFYNIKGSLAQPQMMSVGDVGDMFVPLLEGFLVLPEESGPVLQALLQQLPNMFQDNKETETILLPACQAGLEALKAADTSGQLLVFHTTLPSYNAPGKLINREDRKLLGTDKEKQILSPQTTAYNEVGQACCAAGVSVELFVCNNSYVDCATLGQLPRLTGGQLHKYTYFTHELDGPRLAWDMRRVVSRPTAHDAVMRVRTSTGVRPTDFYGHLYMSNTTDIELAAIDADKAVGIEIKHDDKLTAEDGVYVQAALLYTHRSGQRRLRVINLALAVAHQLADVYRSMELDTCVNFLTKQAVWALREHSPRQVRETLSARCARSLAAYRRHCASPSSAGQLVLPEPMKLLPLYTNCILRSDALAGGPDMSCDDRSCALHRALTADVPLSVVYTYPRLLPLTALLDAPAQRPPPLRASIDKINDHGVYLLENGVHMLLWVGSQAPTEFVRDVFGATSPQQVDTQVGELPDLDTELSRAVRALLQEVRAERRAAMRLTMMRQHDKLEVVLRQFLVEDRGLEGAASYVDYLCHVHKEIRALL